jgi:ferrous iron transport protein A
MKNKILLTKVVDKKKVRIVEVPSGALIQRRLMGMGIYPGREIVKLGHFILKGPVTIKVGRSVVALGHGMANKIFVEVDDEKDPAGR